VGLELVYRVRVTAPYRDRLVAFYIEHNPSKLSEVDAILEILLVERMSSSP